MSHGTELLHQAFAVFLFCNAITLLFLGYQRYATVLNTVKKIESEEIMYEQYKDSDGNVVTRGEIISLFFNQLEYDIQIDELLISKIENVKESISSYSIPYEKYKKSYVYDSKGNITRIIFTRII